MKLVVVMTTAVLAFSFGVSSVARAGAGAERIPILCQAEWNPVTAVTSIYLFAPDTPQTPVGISGFLPFAAASGYGVFTPSGEMSVSCTPNGSPIVNPVGSTWNAKTSCILFRGGADFSLVGAHVYLGTGQVLATPAGNATITCHGSFAGIATGPGFP